MSNPLFLSCTIFGIIPKGIGQVQRISPGKELFLLSGIRRLQPLIPGDEKSSCVITLERDYNELLPSGRIVLKETFHEVAGKIESLII